MIRFCELTLDAVCIRTEIQRRKLYIKAGLISAACTIYVCVVVVVSLVVFFLLRFVFVAGRTCVRSRKAVLHALLPVCFVLEPLVFLFLWEGWV